MVSVCPSAPSRPSLLFRVAALVVLSAVAVHVKYTVHYGEATGAWFRGHWYRNLAAWVYHMLFLFGPPCIVMAMWWRHRSIWVLPGLAGALALIAWITWQPAGLALLSTLELYPSHREAFHNYFERGDWRR